MFKFKKKKDKNYNNSTNININKVNTIFEKLQNNLDSFTFINFIYKNASPLLRRSDTTIDISDNSLIIETKDQSESFQIKVNSSFDSYKRIKISNNSQNGKIVQSKDISFENEFILVNNSILECLDDYETKQTHTVRKVDSFQAYLNEELIYDYMFESLTSNTDISRCYTRKIETFIDEDKQAFREISSTGEEGSLLNTSTIYGKIDFIDGINYRNRKPESNFYMHPMNNISLDEYLQFLKEFQHKILSYDFIQSLKKKMSNN